MSLRGIGKLAAVSLFDFASCGSSLSLRNYARVGSGVSCYAKCYGTGKASVMSYSSIGSSMSLRNYARVGSSLSLAGRGFSFLGMVLEKCF